MADTYRVSILGTGPLGETFDTSFWGYNGAPTTNAAANTLAGLIRDAWVTNARTAMIPMLSTQQKYTEIRLYSYPEGGPTASFIGSAPITTGTGTSGTFNATQIAMVVSLRTAMAGRRHRGRMYLPAAGLASATQHQWTQTQCDDVATAMGNFFSAVNAIGTFGAVVVLSQVGAGEWENVSEIRVDSKPDIQRRRANKLLPSFTSLHTVTNA
jgi:hypothetical protein